MWEITYGKGVTEQEEAELKEDSKVMLTFTFLYGIQIFY